MRTWTTKDGRQIPVKQLEDGHLLHILAMLLSHASRRLDYLLGVYMRTNGPSGEMAQDAFESEFEQLLDAEPEDLVPHIYHHLKQEAQRRGLVQ